MRSTPIHGQPITDVVGPKDDHFSRVRLWPRFFDGTHPPSLVLLYPRSEEHTSELQSQSNLVCRLLLEKKNYRRRGRALRAMASCKPRSCDRPTAGSCRMTSPLEQKKIRITGPSVVTANRTWDGIVIYRTSRQDWSADLSDAAIVRTSDDARALLAESVADDVGAIGAYIAPVEGRDSGAIKPGNLREHIRLQGVTIELPVPA